MEGISLEEGKLQIILNSAQLDQGLPVISEIVTLQRLPWRLMVSSPDVVHNSQGGKGRVVGVFVQCVPSLPGSQNWTALAHVVVRVINRSNAEKGFSKTTPIFASLRTRSIHFQKVSVVGLLSLSVFRGEAVPVHVDKAFDHKYSSSSTDWGYSSFMKYKDLKDPSKGFIKDGKIFLEAKIQIQSNSNDNKSQPLMASGGVDNCFLVCSNCDDDYEVDGDRQPMSLRCGHTFCLVCLKKTLSKSEDKVSIKCSSCNQLHISTKNGNETELWFPNHSMVQIIKNAISKSKYYCRVHQQEKNYYCFNDDILVCIYCAFHGEHSTHMCKHLEDARKEAHRELQSVKLSVSTHVSEIKRHLQFVKDEKELLKCQEASICRMVEDSYEQLKVALQKQKELLFEEVKSQTSELSSNVDANTLKLEEKHSQVKDILNTYTTWATLPVKDALEAYSDIRSQLSSIKSLCDNKALLAKLDLCPKVYFEMCDPSEVLSFAKLGKIVVGKQKNEDPVCTRYHSEIDSQEQYGELCPNRKKRKSSA